MDKREGERRGGVGERRRGWEKGGEEWEKGEDYLCPPPRISKKNRQHKEKVQKGKKHIYVLGYRFCYFPRFFRILELFRRCGKYQKYLKLTHIAEDRV